MSTFIEYLVETVKTYEFKIKIAGKLDSGFAKSIKETLSKYDCASVSKGRRLPIQESPLDFPALKNSEVTIFDVVCRYPATPQVITEFLSDTLKINKGSIVVRTTQEDLNFEANAEAFARVGTKGESLLNKPYEDDKKKDNQLSFLKDLGKVSHKGEQYKGVNDSILAKSAPNGTQSQKDDNIGTTSPIGSLAIKFVDPFKGQKK
jgi:hypothetical protein